MTTAHRIERSLALLLALALFGASPFAQERDRERARQDKRVAQSATPEAERANRGEPLRFEGLEGTWEGFYGTGPSVSGVRLTLEPGGAAEEAELDPAEARLRRLRTALQRHAPLANQGVAVLHGRLDFYPIAESIDPRRSAGPSGAHEVVVQIHSATGAFVLTPGAWIDQPQGALLMRLHMAGLFDASEPSLFGAAAAQARADAAYSFPAALWRPAAVAGPVATMKAALRPLSMVPPTPDMETLTAIQKEMASELAKVREEMGKIDPSDFEKLREYQAKMAGIQQRFQERMMLAQMGAADMELTHDDIAAWVKGAVRGHPEVMKNERPNLVSIFEGQKLVADEHFVPTFGKPIEELTPKERTAIGYMVNSSRRIQTELNEWEYTGSVLIDLLGGNYPLTVGRELVQRRLRAYRAVLLSNLKTLEPDADTFDDLATWQSVAEKLFGSLWESEQAEALAAIEATRPRVADGVLVARAERDAAATADLGGTMWLAAFDDRQADLGPYTTPEARARADEIVGRRLDELVADAVAERRSRIPTLGMGLAAVRGGVNWYRELTAFLGHTIERPPVRAAVGELRGRRPADLQAALVELMELLAACRTIPEVDTLLAGTVSVPGDYETEAGATLYEASLRRRVEIDRELFLARFSPREQELMGDGIRVAVPAEITEPPTAEEIRLAYLREVEAIGGKMMDHQSAQVSMPGLNMLGLYNDVLVQSVTVVQSRADGPLSFVCAYDIDVHFSVGKPFQGLMSGNSPQAQLMNDLIALGNDYGPTRTVDRFVFTSSGWRSPTIRDRGLESIASFYGSVADGLQSASSILGF